LTCNFFKTSVVSKEVYTFNFTFHIHFTLNTNIHFTFRFIECSIHEWAEVIADENNDQVYKVVFLRSTRLYKTLN
jgi:hypothetical protein